jgi:TolA-binding protein
MDKPIENAFRNHPPKLAEADAVAGAATALDQAEGALASGDSGAAMKALATLPPTARNDAAVKQRVDKALAQLAPLAEAAITEADGLIEQKQFADAATKLNDVAKGLPGTPAGLKAKAKLDEVSKMPEVKVELAKAAAAAKAGEELAAAQQLQADGNNEQAYVKFKSIARNYADTEAAQVAQAAVAEYEKDPAFAKRANETVAGGKAKGMLGLAQSYKTSGKPELAKKKYQEVVDQFPDTSYAETAKKELSAMK